MFKKIGGEGSKKQNLSEDRILAFGILSIMAGRGAGAAGKNGVTGSFWMVPLEAQNPSST